MSSYDKKNTEIENLVNTLVEKLQSTSMTTSLPKTKEDIATTLVSKLQNKEKFSDDENNDEIIDDLEELRQEREDQDRDILGIEPSDENDSEDNTNDEEKEEEEEEEDIMKKFKWVLIGIGVFVLVSIIAGIIYWFYFSEPSQSY